MTVSRNLSPVLQKVSALQQYSIVCSPAPAQWAAIAALENPLTDELEVMKKRRNRVIELLTGKVSFPHPDGAFYVFPSIPVDSREFVHLAIGAELLIVPGYIFTRDSNTIRISYAQKDEILEEGLNIFLSLLEMVQHR
jgi:aspartate/methionine/tyrosine aminotransferase